LRIATLHATRHRLADEWKRLVAIESSQLDDLAVERETDGREVRVTKPMRRLSLSLGASPSINCT
jgi:hypothetical protein